MQTHEAAGADLIRVPDGFGAGIYAVWLMPRGSASE